MARAESSSTSTPPFACPRCGKSLDAALRCAACRVEFPIVGGLPWLFAEPSAAIADWRVRFDRTLTDLESDANKSAKALAATDLHPLTRSRLERLLHAQRAHADELRGVMQPLTADASRTALETHLALRTRIAPSQGLTTYYGNLHRDWCWGGEENARSCELVAAALPDLAGARLLVLGSGGARLAYDLHVRCAPALTVALDANPLLSFAADRIARGERLPMHEFPLAPATSIEVAVPRELAAPAPAPAGFRVVVGDALRAPFEQDSFDAVVTPWFVDIVDEDFRTLARRINRLLRPQSTWVVFGSMRFASPDPAACLCADEAAALVEDAGFAPPPVVEATLPYLCSPASRHARTERVVTLAAKKVKRAAHVDRHRAVPEWLVGSKHPVPLLDAFRLQAGTTQIYAFLMSMIDGRRTLDDMAMLMEQKRLMPRAEAEAALRAFLLKMWDESRSTDGLR